MQNKEWISIALTIAISIAVMIGLRVVFKRVVKKSDKIHRRYLGNLLYLIVIICCLLNIFSLLNPDMNIHTTILRGSALIVAIIGFAAQPAILDLICGFLISINKPFEIGDRIIAEGIEPGIVEDITLRHTVIRIYDGLRIIVPNSTLNSKTVINTSRGDRRGIHLTYSVSYDTDLTMAVDAIRDCVAESPYTLPVETNGIMEDSGPVYFLKYGESALILETTIWIDKKSNSYVAVTDVNMRINRLFRQLGIEIPYNYVNVVEREYVSDEAEGVRKKKTAPSKRSARTDTIKVSLEDDHIEKAMETARAFAKKQRLGDKTAKQLELMSEEVIGIMGSISKNAKAKFWIDGSGQKFRIHMSFPTAVGIEEYKRLLSLSTSGKNEAIKTISDKIRETVTTGILNNSDDKAQDFEWSIHDEPNTVQIGESILVSLADDIKVNVTREKVEILVVKSVKTE